MGVFITLSKRPHGKTDRFKPRPLLYVIVKSSWNRQLHLLTTNRLTKKKKVGYFGVCGLWIFEVRGSPLPLHGVRCKLLACREMLLICKQIWFVAAESTCVSFFRRFCASSVVGLLWPDWAINCGDVLWLFKEVMACQYWVTWGHFDGSQWRLLARWY